MDDADIENFFSRPSGAVGDAKDTGAPFLTWARPDVEQMQEMPRRSSACEDEEAAPAQLRSPSSMGPLSQLPPPHAHPRCCSEPSIGPAAQFSAMAFSAAAPDDFYPPVERPAPVRPRAGRSLVCCPRCRLEFVLEQPAAAPWAQPFLLAGASSLPQLAGERMPPLFADAGADSEVPATLDELARTVRYFNSSNAHPSPIIAKRRDAFPLAYTPVEVDPSGQQKVSIQKGLLCACRECCNVLANPDSRSPYCSKQCQVREQNIRQTRVRPRTELIALKQQLLAELLARKEELPTREAVTHFVMMWKIRHSDE